MPQSWGTGALHHDKGYSMSTPVQKSLTAVRDALEVVRNVSVQGKDCARLANVIAFLECIEAEYSAQLPAPEVADDKASA